MTRRGFLLTALLGAFAAASACTAREEGASRRGEKVVLPEPGPATMTLAAALARRRSIREYVDQPLTMSEIGQLLWASQGITSANGLRTAPSAGALYPLAVYVAVPDGLFRYEPDGHRMERRSDADLRAPLGRVALRQEWVGAAPAVFAISGDVSRTAVKYGERAERYVLLEAGHAAQNLLLQAVALGLRGVPVGSFDDDETGALLLLPRNERPVYLVPVGRPRMGG